MTATISFEGVEQQALRNFTEKAYLDYSMYVILDRALPHLTDGLKPVQRRIIYAMSELGLSAQSKPKKSARTVGDVIGKFHPHGDSACYEAMVLMAQSFSFRYPLIDGQGNWGSQDNPKSFAAMRYTESRLTPFSKLLLDELGEGTVDWGANYDGTLQEPRLLPSRVPHVLLNGATGIAVGMATDIPPHNLREVVSAAIRLLEDPRADVDALMEHLPGPDFPTEAEIISTRDELRELYIKGMGSIRMRARYLTEGSDIVLTALPYQVSGERIQEQIAAQISAKKLPLVEDVRDESDHENPTRIVIVPRGRKGSDSEAIMSHLFATTDLERSYRVNLNMIGVDGRPRVKNLLEVLTEWLDWRKETVRRRLQWRLDKVEARLHILEGLLIAFLNLDEVIKIIREEERPKPALMSRFELSEIQADYILDTRLRQLSRLEEIKIRGEQEELERERGQIEKLLGSDRRLKGLIRKELERDAERYGDDRRSPIVQRTAARALDESRLLPAEAITVVLSQRGWVRAAKGHEVDAEGLNYKSGDGYQDAAFGRSNQPALFFDNTGRVYTVAAHSLPSARSQGEPLSGRLNPPDGARFVGVLMGEPTERCLLASSAGYGFVNSFDDLVSRNRSGKRVLNAPEGSHLLAPAKILNPKEDRLAALTDSGRLLLFPISELPEMQKGKGNKIIDLGSDETLLMIEALPIGGSLLVWSDAGERKLSAKELANYLGERGRRGKLLPRAMQRVEGMARG